MGGVYSILCPTLQLGSMTSPYPTSGWKETHDHQDATEQGCQDEKSCQDLDLPPETVMAAATLSRDQSFSEDYVTMPNNTTWRVRSSERSSLSDADMPIPVSSRCDAARRDVMTSQLEPEEGRASGVGRRRFRHAALTITNQLIEIGNSELTLDAEKRVQLGSSSAEGVNERSDDVPDSVRTSADIISTSCFSSVKLNSCGTRSTLLEELLAARAKTQQVCVPVWQQDQSSHVSYDRCRLSVCLSVCHTPVPRGDN